MDLNFFFRSKEFNHNTHTPPQHCGIVLQQPLKQTRPLFTEGMFNLFWSLRYQLCMWRQTCKQALKYKMHLYTLS